jgi:hypothetical protein
MKNAQSHKRSYREGEQTGISGRDGMKAVIEFTQSSPTVNDSTKSPKNDMKNV